MLGGKAASQAFWLFIQHSPLPIEEKYFPSMQAAVLNGGADPINCAYLEDRILMFKNLPQKYGSQYQSLTQIGKEYLYPLQDKTNVNKMRESIGLPPLSQIDIDSSMQYEKDKTKME